MTKPTIAKWLGGAVLLASFAILVWFLNRTEIPEEPVPIVWDRETCGHCGMHIGDPRFAAQLHTAGGSVVSFDDPGCLADYQRSRPAPHALYFRDSRSDAWLSEPEAGFLPTDESPMGYGIIAVEKSTPGARGWDWAQEQTVRPSNGGHP